MKPGLSRQQLTVPYDDQIALGGCTPRQLAVHLRGEEPRPGVFGGGNDVAVDAVDALEGGHTVPRCEIGQLPDAEIVRVEPGFLGQLAGQRCVVGLAHAHVAAHAEVEGTGKGGIASSRRHPQATVRVDNEAVGHAAPALGVTQRGTRARTDRHIIRVDQGELLDHLGLHATERVPSDVGKLIAALGFETLPIQALGGYMGRCESYFVGSHAVLKVYRQHAQAARRRETAALAVLSGSGLPVPSAPATGVLASGAAWAVITRLPGIPLADLPRPGDAVVRALAEQAGTWASLLHAHTARPLRRLQLSAYRRRRVRHAKAAAAAATAGDASLVAAITARLAALEASLVLAGPTVLVHRDYSARNLLADDDWRLSGIIDFEKSWWGDPIEEFATQALHHFRYDRVWKAGFLAGYGPLPGEACDDRFTYHTLSLALRGLAWSPSRDPGYALTLTQLARDVLDGSVDVGTP